MWYFSSYFLKEGPLLLLPIASKKSCKQLEEGGQEESCHPDYD